MTPRIAALYVATGGVYDGADGVDAWAWPSRDARQYAGPWAVVAHPPCARWGRYAAGGPSHQGRFRVGDDDGCFAAALASVRAWGGVLEHPKDSHAWAAFGLMAPLAIGGWSPAGDGMGWTCCVDQGHYGHPCAKATWLYAVGVELPSLRWGRYRGPVRAIIDRSARDRADHQARRADQKARGVVLLSARKRAATPVEFRDVLVAMARTSTKGIAR